MNGSSILFLAKETKVWKNQRAFKPQPKDSKPKYLLSPNHTWGWNFPLGSLFPDIHFTSGENESMETSIKNYSELYRSLK